MHIIFWESVTQSVLRFEVTESSGIWCLCNANMTHLDFITNSI